MVLSALFWIGLAFLFKMAVEDGLLVIGVDRFAIGAAVLIILAYLVAHLRKARRVAYLRGEAVEIGTKQHPDLFSLFQSPVSGYQFSRLKRRGHRCTDRSSGGYRLRNGPRTGAHRRPPGAVDHLLAASVSVAIDRRCLRACQNLQL